MIPEGLQPYWRAFHILSDSRGIAMGMGGGSPLAIAYSELVCYAREHGYADTVEDLDEFVGVMRAMDRVWLERNQPD